jgi:hypothetical protein
MPKLPRGPVALAVIGSLLLVALLTIIGTAIGGSYILMEHYVTALTAQQHAAQAKGAVGLCKAVLQMDLAGKGAVFSGKGTLAYGYKLASAIHQLYASSGCSAIIGIGG